MTANIKRILACVYGQAVVFTFFLSVFYIGAGQANAMTIQKIVSPGGIEAWLVEEHSVPLIAMRFGFFGGSAQDPPDRVGVSYFVSGMLDEGAGDLKAEAFQERAEELAIRMNFDTTRDTFIGNFQTLTKNRDEAFGLLKLALTEPRFDKDAVDRIRKQILASLRFDLNDPSKVAARAWFKLAFADHPYSRPRKGDFDTLKEITGKDLKAYVDNVFARNNLRIAVVGDIDGEVLGKLLDQVFGALPEKANLKAVPEAVVPDVAKREIISMEIPQSVAQFGFAGVKRKDPDFIPSYVLNYVIGGGGFSSQLVKEVREKRGLAYSVHSYLYPYHKGAAYIGGVATQNKDMGKSLTVIRKELERVANEGITSEELEAAKKYLTGSYALRFDTSSKIASQLLWIQLEGLGAEYVDKRNGLIEAVTLQDIRRVAQRLLKTENLIVTIVGKPEGLPELRVKEETDIRG